MTRLRQQRWGFQAKVLVPVIAILVALLASTLWLVNRHVGQEFRTTAAQSLATADAVFQNSQQLRIKNLLLLFRNVPNEPRFKAVCQLGDPPTFRVLLAELLGDLAADAAMFTTWEGEVLAAAGRDPAFPLPAFASASAASIRKASTEGLPTADLIEVGGRFFDAVSIPSIVGGQFLGVLTFGVEIGDAVALEFGQLARAEIVLLAEGRVAAMTLAAATQPAGKLTELFAGSTHQAGTRAVVTQEIVLNDEHFLGTAGRLATLDETRQFGYVLLASYEQHLHTLDQTQRRIALIGLFGIISSTAILWRVIRGITRPLRHLRDAAELIGRGDFATRVPVTSRDECGELAIVVNQMTANLNASRAQLQEAHSGLELRVQERTAELSNEIDRREQAQRDADAAHARLLVISRQAGMAEVATDVLHNVGNVLNSVNVSVTLVVDQLRKSKTPSLAKAVHLLREHSDDVGEFVTNDPKGRQIPAFLDAVSEQLTREQSVLTQEMHGLQKSIEHIKQTVATQQSYARVSGAMEMLAPYELIEEALSMIDVELARHHIEIVREFDHVPPVLADRHKVLQILLNLFSNAEHALNQRPDGRRLVLRVGLGENDRVRIEVQDNGQGIASENLTRIFTHGFTTKRDGHGFGLHSGANAAKEMGGSLQAQSNGLGQGAAFFLELPAGESVAQDQPPSADIVGMRSQPTRHASPVTP